MNVLFASDMTFTLRSFALKWSRASKHWWHCCLWSLSLIFTNPNFFWLCGGAQDFKSRVDLISMLFNLDELYFAWMLMAVIVSYVTSICFLLFPWMLRFMWLVCHNTSRIKEELVKSVSPRKGEWPPFWICHMPYVIHPSSWIMASFA